MKRAYENRIGENELNEKKSILKASDRFVTKTYQKFFREKKGIIIPFFHILFKDEDEISKNLVDPETGILIDKFQEIIEFFLNKDFIFIKPNDLLKNLSKNENYILLTFDDGYYNNTLSIPILKKYKIPATFFISTKNILNNKCFWWDVLYREMKKLGHSRKKISQEQAEYKKFTTDKIVERIENIFGKDSFKPVCDIDRPFNKFELKKFSKNDYVVIGNHTHSHSILTNYSFKDIKNEIQIANTNLIKILGKKVNVISYPNGNFSNEVIKITKELGFEYGFTVEPKKNYLPIGKSKDDYLKLGRFFVGNWKNIEEKCESMMSDFNMHRKIFYRFKNGY